MNVSTPDLIAGTLVLWGVGLMPALGIRFVLMHRPLSWWLSAFLSAGVWLGLFSLFYWPYYLVDDVASFDSRQHGGIALVALVSYYILRLKRTEAVGLVSDTSDGVREPDAEPVSAPGRAQSNVVAKEVEGTSAAAPHARCASKPGPNGRGSAAASDRQVSMRLVISFSLGLALGSGLTYLISELSAPRSFEECLLKNLRGVQGDTTATLVDEACWKLYQPSN